MKIVFFGTPTIAAEALAFLLQHGIEVAAVVTKPDKPQGRSSELIPTPVKKVAQAHTPPIPVLQPEKVSAPEHAPTLEQYKADLFVVVAYGEILKQHLLDMPKTACINMHVSLLPKYRGAAPIQRAVINGESETGVTIMHMVKKMDAGNIISTVKVPIGPDTTFGELERTVSRDGARLLLQTIQDFAAGKELPGTAQDESQATLAPKIELEDCKIDWSQPAQTIHNLIRGVNPYPGAWCMVEAKGQQKRLRLMTSKLSDSRSTLPPGSLVPSPAGALLVNCGSGTIEVLELQMEGKKAMLAADFMRGHPAGTLKFI